MNELKRQTSSRKTKRAILWPWLRLGITLLVFGLITSSVTGGTVCYVGANDTGIACPLGVVQIFVATGKILSVMAIAGLLGIAVVLFFGRAFCSWVCPGRWLFNRFAKQGHISHTLRAWLQGGVVFGVLFFAWACKFPIFCTICPAGVFCRGALAGKTNSNLLPLVGWTGMLVGTEWIIGFSWCQDLCPLGTVLGYLSRFNPFFKVKANPEKCVPCRACEKACPEGLNLSAGVNLSRCTKCFACQSACPRDAVQIKLI